MYIQNLTKSISFNKGTESDTVKIDNDDTISPKC